MPILLAAPRTGLHHTVNLLRRRAGIGMAQGKGAEARPVQALIHLLNHSQYFFHQPGRRGHDQRIARGVHRNRALAAQQLRQRFSQFHRAGLAQGNNAGHQLGRKRAEIAPPLDRRGGPSIRIRHDSVKVAAFDHPEPVHFHDIQKDLIGFVH